ncbi:MAG: hypothetical protein HOM52_12110 [Rhodospirillaceae bacterium]|nr:hypothetical protein [Rhodospirillaceae bacterium]MBT3926045.1 hypothetical protein [Rhodospirillaceae bacterium]MBT4425991.1 hypothetical protein [Rhodospirillaceae bacterium]MBT5039247.1 hypothetical protein [Rhodospirillaceae bacterium]MBT5674969.1 hypothetical protein [Rhodospirillaceae bacterium]
MSAVTERIGLVANSPLRYLMVDIARALRERYGSTIHLYSTNKQKLGHFESQNTDGVFTSITGDMGLVNLTSRPESNQDTLLAKAREYERRIGRTYNSLAVGNRHLGRGYALAGNGHPRSRMATESDYLALVHSYNEHFDRWQREIDEKRLTLILFGPGETPCIARANGVPFRTLVGSRHKNYHYWAHDEFISNPNIEAAYHALKGDRPQQPAQDEAYKLAEIHTPKFLRDLTFSRTVWRTGVHAARRIYWRFRGYEKAKNYYAMDELAMLMRQWRDRRRMTRPTMAKLSDLTDTPFVFFPLATEPESSIGQYSPEFFFQHAAIAALSRDLPAGMKLAVKEAVWAVGRRPADFYKQIAELKNVVWLNMTEQGIHIAQQATAVATITGTSGFEAAVHGTPVISFGAHNHYNFLPHVAYVSDLAKLGEHLGPLLGADFDRQAAQAAGKRFLDAIVETSFDLGEYDYINFKSYDDRVVNDATTALVDSLDSDVVKQQLQA